MFTVELDFELADKITLDNLTDCYHSTLDDQNILLGVRPVMSDYQKEDYHYNVKLLKSLRRVIKHFCTLDEFQQRIKEK